MHTCTNSLYIITKEANNSGKGVAQHLQMPWEWFDKMPWVTNSARCDENQAKLIKVTQEQTEWMKSF